MDGSQKLPLRELIKHEYTECLKSPSYFMRKYCKIQHPTLGTIPFALYDFQDKTLESFRDEQFNIVLKARQMGISTLVSGYALWLMTFFHRQIYSVYCYQPRNCKKYCYKSNSYVRKFTKLVAK